MTKYVIDTNVLMNDAEMLSTLEGDVLIPVFVLEELDKLKTFPDHRGVQARTAVRYLKSNPQAATFALEDGLSLDCLPETWDKDKYDNKILAFAHMHGAVVVSYDFNVQLKARHLGLDVLSFEDETPKRAFTGVREVFVNDPHTDEMLLAHFEHPEDNVYDLYPNEYLIVYDKSTAYYNNRGELTYRKLSGSRIQRWDGDQFCELRRPKNADFEPLNDLQECAIDLLYNDDVPIKIITGGYGSGKTLLSLRTGLHLVQKDRQYNKVMCVRNPEGDTDSKEIGFLKGDKEDKLEAFFKPIQHNLPGDGGEYMMRLLTEKKMLDFESPAFMKGMSIKDSFILVDEAEDLTLKTLKLIGTRLASNSVICFSGDYNQTEQKYKANNGLLKLIDGTKEEPLVGCVQLSEDVRSSASKVFANLD